MTESTRPLLHEQSLDEPGAAHVATTSGDIAGLRELPSEAFQQAFRGTFPWHAAAAYNQLPALDFFLGSRGVDVDAADSQGRSLLTHAVVGRAAEAIAWLVHHGASFKAFDESGQSAVHWAASLGRTQELALLHNLRANLEEVDGDGRTALELAVMGGNLETVEYLVLTRGCDKAVREAASKALQPGPCAFWMKRCLHDQVGCHDTLETPLLGPTMGLCALPLASRCCRGPDYVHVEPRQFCIAVGILAAAFALHLLTLPTPQQPRGCHAAAVLAFCCTCVGTVCFTCATLWSPGELDSSALSCKEDYRAALEHAAAVSQADAERKVWNWWGTKAPVMHELAIVGPERSKYCRASRRCVPMFDHYCAFLRNSVGPGNYAVFFLATLCASLTCSCLASAASVALECGELPVAEQRLLTLAIPLFGLLAVPWTAMIAFHIFLAYLGLTTWEMIQISKKPVAYLVDESTGKYANPYDRGFARNFCAKFRGVQLDRDGARADSAV